MGRNPVLTTGSAGRCEVTKTGLERGFGLREGLLSWG